MKSQDLNDLNDSGILAVLSDTMASGYMILSALLANVFLGNELVESRLLAVHLYLYQLHRAYPGEENVFVVELWIPASDKEGRIVFSKPGYPGSVLVDLPRDREHWRVVQDDLIGDVHLYKSWLNVAFT